MKGGVIPLFFLAFLLVFGQFLGQCDSLSNRYLIAPNSRPV